MKRCQCGCTILLVSDSKKLTVCPIVFAVGKDFLQEKPCVVGPACTHKHYALQHVAWSRLKTIQQYTKASSIFSREYFYTHKHISICIPSPNINKARFRQVQSQRNIKLSSIMKNLILKIRRRYQ